VANASHVDRRRYTWRDYWRDAVPLMLMALFVWAIVLGTPTQKDLQRVERADRDTARATAFRLCTRNRVDRAYAHARERGLVIAGLPHPPRMSFAERRLRRMFSRLLMDPHLLPILDCEPNVMGHGARPLPVRDQERFVRQWARRVLPEVALGICPDSTIPGAPSSRRC
jgi:hypothetical protein